jgi:enoyl-CoA hydratase
MLASDILYERQGRVALITLNIPERRNVLSSQNLLYLSELLNRIQHDTYLRSVVITGAGQDYFCAGVNEDELVQTESSNTSQSSSCVTYVCKQMERSRVPVVAAVNGAAKDDGCSLIFAAHLTIASDNATFSWRRAEPDLITAYGFGASNQCCEGTAGAKNPIQTTSAISANEALAMGLVNRVVSYNNAIPEAISLAGQIAEHAPLAISRCIEAVTRGLELTLAEGLTLESKLFASLFATADMQEGTTAFLEKRRPNFRGK